MIRCEGLVHVYPDGTRAVDGMELEIRPGERVAITGPNGSGKSTLVRHWNGLLRPTGGTVLVDGRATADRHVAELARVVGMAFQDPGAQLFASTCRAEVAFGARNAGARGDDIERIVEESLRLVGLLDRARTNPYDLGPSKRRLLTIASVLAMQPRVIVLDEPTIGLDAGEVELLREVVDAEAGRGRTIVAISHDARFLEGSFERTLRLEAGRVVGDEPLALPRAIVTAGASAAPGRHQQQE